MKKILILFLLLISATYNLYAVTPLPPQDTECECTGYFEVLEKSRQNEGLIGSLWERVYPQYDNNGIRIYPDFIRPENELPSNYNYCTSYTFPSIKNDDIYVRYNDVVSYSVWFYPVFPYFKQKSMNHAFNVIKYKCVPYPTCDDNQTLDTNTTPPTCKPNPPICDDNQTLNTSFDPPRCVDNPPTCTDPDTDFPTLKTHQSVIYAPWTLPSKLDKQCKDVQGNVQASKVDCVDTYRCMCPYTPYPKMADNEEVFFTWSANGGVDKTSLCQALKGHVQQERLACATNYRCVGLTEDKPKEEPECISSYVSPRDGTFHEDIGIDGVGFGLHYDSSEWNSTSIAHGWSVSAHARLEGDRLYYGSGSVRVVDISTVENGLTVVLSGSNEYLFDANGKLQTIRDLYTKETKTTFSYDLVGNLVTLTDIYGEISTIERDSNGMVTAIVSPTGQRTLLSIDVNGDLVEVQYEDTSSYAFEYERHLMTVETEPNGNRFLHFFDDSGNVVKVIDAEQGEWNFGSTSTDTYGSHTVTRASGDVIVYKNHFLENNTTLRSEKLLPTGDVVEYTNSIDDSMSSTKSCGMTTTNLYKTNPDGSLFKDVYTGKRVLERSTVVTPSGLSYNTSFDISYTIDENQTFISALQTTNQNGAISTNKRDYLNHTSIVTSAEGRETIIKYDALNKLPLKIKTNNLAPLLYTYDTKGRVIKSKQGKRVTTYTYDDRGNLAEKYNVQRDTKTTYAYDSRDRIIQTTYSDGSIEQYAYDANSNLISRTVPTPADHLFAYNGVNKNVGYTSPLQKQTTYTYDKQRRVINTTKPSGKSIETTYTNGRVTSVQTPEGTANYSYSCQSNVANITKNSESLDFTYDGTLLASLIQRGTLNQTLDYNYDNDFRLNSFTYADKTENYTYDLDGLLTQSGDYTITRNAQNGLVEQVSDGLFNISYRYNKFGEVKRAKDNLFMYRVKRAKGRIASKREVLTVKVPKKRKGFRKKKKISLYYYTYDNRDRLIEVRKGKAKRLMESYSYDANGNRQSATVNGTTVTASYTLDDNLVVYGDNSYLYDEDGYLTEKTTPDGSTSYSYGTIGELLSVTTPTKSIIYKQNANNQRVAKLVNGTITEKYLWANLTTLLAIYDSNDNLVQRFEYAEQRMPVSMTSNGQKYYLHYDQVGTLRAISDTQMNIVKEITYDTFGNILSDTNLSFKVPFGFAGGLYDSDTKLTRFGYRDYDAYTGKWAAKDPIGFQGGDSNLYGYVLGDPVNFIDPTGKISIQEGIEDVMQTGIENSLGGYDASKEASNHARESRLPGSTNGQQDAYRHCVWNCIMTRKIGKSAARRIANNHEKHGGIDNQPKMDKCNNLSGRSVAGHKGACPNLCMQLLKNGDLYVLPMEMWR